MGYYTRYSLSTKPPTTVSLDLLETITGYGWEENGNGSYDPGDSLKWYDSTENMKELSKVLPDTLFTLDGEGEESGDVWRAYFQNGKYQHCQAEIKIEEYDPLKMK